MTLFFLIGFFFYYYFLKFFNLLSQIMYVWILLHYFIFYTTPAFIVYIKSFLLNISTTHFHLILILSQQLSFFIFIFLWQMRYSQCSFFFHMWGKFMFVLLRTIIMILILDWLVCFRSDLNLFKTGLLLISYIRVVQRFSKFFVCCFSFLRRGVILLLLILI